MFKKILILTGTLLAISSVQASWYADGNLGWGKVDQSVNLSTTQKNSGFAFGADLGYKISQNFAVEGGFLDLPNQSYDFGISGRKNYNFDVAAKGTLPLQNGLSVFGKLGIAAVHHQLNINNATYTSTGLGTYTRAAALLGAGIGYNVNQNWGVITQFTATTKNSPVPATYAVTGGLLFNFG